MFETDKHPGLHIFKSWHMKSPTFEIVIRDWNNSVFSKMICNCYY